jgi:predicted RNA-binding protein
VYRAAKNHRNELINELIGEGIAEISIGEGKVTLTDIIGCKTEVDGMLSKIDLVGNTVIVASGGLG